MAAITAISTFVKQGDHVVCSNMTYGGTYRYYTKILASYGVTFDFVDTADPAAVERAIRPETRMLHLESPTNPTMRLADIAQLSELAHRVGAIVVVDNTFASPYLQQPLSLGADIVMHSTTKFLGGHSDTVGGAAIAKSKEHVEWLGFVQNSSGAILSPMDSLLVLRGIKTLVVRMERHEANGRKVAEHLARHPKIKQVHYPGLAVPSPARAREEADAGFGAMISFDLGSLEAAGAFLAKVRLCSLGESLGGVETLISHPASMTHGSIPEEERNRLGVTPGLVRISVGIEDVGRHPRRPRPGAGLTSRAWASGLSLSPPLGDASVSGRRVPSGTERRPGASGREPASTWPSARTARRRTWGRSGSER